MRFVEAVESFHLLELFLGECLIRSRPVASTTFLGDLLHLHHSLLQGPARCEAGNGENHNADSKEGWWNQQKPSYEIISHVDQSVLEFIGIEKRKETEFESFFLPC